MSDFDSQLSNNKDEDAELEEFVMIQKQKAQVNATIHEFNDICWDKCMDKPGNKIDSRTEQCLSNCVERFIDTSVLVANRFSQRLDKSMSQ